jgi:hypothetical protein
MDAMDAMSEVLGSVRLKASIFTRSEAGCRPSHDRVVAFVAVENTA